MVKFAAPKDLAARARLNDPVHQEQRLQTPYSLNSGSADTSLLYCCVYDGNTVIHLTLTSWSINAGQLITDYTLSRIFQLLLGRTAGSELATAVHLA